MSTIFVTFMGFVGDRVMRFQPLFMCGTCNGRGRIRYCRCPHCGGRGVR